MPIQRPPGSVPARSLPPLTAAHLAGGISKQPPHLRFPGQLADADNAVFGIADGLSKRPGTRYETNVGGLSDQYGNFRVHPIDRSSDEQYLVVYGEGEWLIYDAVNGGFVTPTISGAAQAYLDTNDAGADEIRLVTAKDTTFIVNTTVPVATRSMDAYTITGDYRDYGVMTADTPADSTHHRTTQDGSGQTAGYWKYDVGGVSFAKRVGANLTSATWATPTGSWDNSADSPHTVRIRFGKKYPNYTAATWTAASRTITKANAFSGYTFVSGDLHYISAGTGHTPGWYAIASKVSDSAITLAAAAGLAGANNADTAGTHIATQHDVSVTNSGSAEGDMHAVAAKIQLALAASGATDALCGWTFSDSAAGRFTLTSPYRGSGAQLIECSAVGSGTDLSAASAPFDPSGSTFTAGSGSGSLSLSVPARWTRRPGPGESDAIIDERTAPVTLTRTAIDPLAFEIDVVDWNDRASGDAASNPSPRIFRRATASGVLTANTAANPSVVTCQGHGLASGDVIDLVASNSTPVLDGRRTVTVIDADSFSVPVNVGVAGTSGRWTRGVVAIADLNIVRGRLALIGGDHFTTSQAGDLYNFFLESAPTVGDADPIDLTIGTDEVAGAEFLASIAGTTIVFTRAGRQYELADTEALTPLSARLNLASRRRISDPTPGTRPRPWGNRLIFLSPTNDGTNLREYERDALEGSRDASASDHVPGLVPSSIRTLDAAPSDGIAFLLSPDDHGVYIHQAHRDGSGRKDQSAWGRWSFDETYRISDMAVLDDDLWILVEEAGLATLSAANPTVVTYPGHGYVNGNTVRIIESTTSPSADGTHVVSNATANTFTVPVNVTVAGAARVARGTFHLERVTTGRASLPTRVAGHGDWRYTIHMDRQIFATGVFDAGNNWTTWSLPSGLAGEGSTLTHIVLGPAFGSSSGNQVSISAYGSNFVRVTGGDYSAGLAAIGSRFDFSCELSRPYLRDEDGRPDLAALVLCRDLRTTHVGSGGYSVRVGYSAPNTTEVTTTYSPSPSHTPDEIGELLALCMGEASGLTAYLESSSAMPLTIAGIQFEADLGMGARP